MGKPFVKFLGGDTEEYPLISCVMPTYGRPAYVPEAVNCFLDQDYPNKELILLNDCDGQTFVGNVPGVRIINDSRRYPSLGDKRNASIEAAGGDLIAIWDDDDISLPWRLSFSWREMLRYQTPFFRPAEFCAYWGDEKLHNNQAVRGWVSHGIVLFTKQLWRQVKGYPSIGVGEDAKFFQKIHKSMGAEFIKYPIARSDRYYVMRGVSHYSHASIGGGQNPADQSPGQFDIAPQPIADPVLAKACEILVANRGIHASTVKTRPPQIRKVNRQKKTTQSRNPLISVCIALKNRSRVLHEHRLLDLFPRTVRSLSDVANEIGPIELVVTDFHSDDWPLEQWIISGGNLDIRVLRVNGSFSRGRGLNLAVQAASSDSLFLSDADMLIGAEALKRGRAAIERGAARFPICSYQSLDGQHKNWGKAAYGLAFLNRKQYELAGGVREFESWGGEDDLFFKALKGVAPIEREKDSDLKHQWHPPGIRNENYRRPARADYLEATKGVHTDAPKTEMPIIMDAKHPHWVGDSQELRLYGDGRMERPDVDQGVYALERDDRLVLFWNRWDPESLQWNAASRQFENGPKGFVLRLPQHGELDDWRPRLYATDKQSEYRFESPSRLVIGLGTGRCGTVSLSRLLNRQPNWRIFHEAVAGAVGWSGSGDLLEARMANWLQPPHFQVVGDVASYYLPYCRRILQMHPETRFLCLERPREQVIESFMRKTPGTNHWQPHDGQGKWRLCSTYDKNFPKYPDAGDKRKAIGAYWDEYQHEATILERELPECFRIFPTSALNEDQGVQNILDFAQLPKDQQRREIGIHRNRS